MIQILDNKLYEAFANAASNIFVYVTDIEQNLTRWSQGAVNYFGLEDEYQYNTVEKWATYVHPDERQIYVDEITAVLSGKKEQHNCQYRVRNKHGEYTWVECRGSIIKDDNGKPTIFAGIMTILEFQSKYDTLTHLLTGYQLTRHPFSDTGALMLIGIDSFRNINSRYGLVYGNKVLKYFAEVLESKSRGATLYRLQADEFALCGKDMTAQDMVAIYKEVSSICSQSDKGSEIINFNTSAGITEFSNEDSSVRPLANAELCLGYAKKDTVNHYIVYSNEFEKKQLRRNIVSEALLESLDDNFKGFYLVYQPIMSNEGDSVVACEALVRWNPNNSEIGNCYPDEFISILESNGGINELGYFVMRQSIKQAGIWQKTYKKFNVSFNVSYLQLEDPNFVPEIIKTIEEYGVDPTGIVVELTESVLDVDTVMLMNSFSLLRSKGIRIALDDFGTGNSSFWMLHNIDVDIVKLDQTFIRGLDTSGKGIDYAIVESIGLMCNRIGCTTVAEGIETDEIWKLISKFRFTGLQGYLFSRPIEVSNFENLLEKYNMIKLN